MSDLRGPSMRFWFTHSAKMGGQARVKEGTGLAPTGIWSFEPKLFCGFSYHFVFMWGCNRRTGGLACCIECCQHNNVKQIKVFTLYCRSPLGQLVSTVCFWFVFAMKLCQAGSFYKALPEIIPRCLSLPGLKGGLVTKDKIVCQRKYVVLLFCCLLIRTDLLFFCFVVDGTWKHTRNTS